MKTPLSCSTLLCLGLILTGSFLGSPLSAVAAADVASTPRTVSPGLRLLEELQTVITDLAEQAKPSVVSIFPKLLTKRMLPI